MNFQIPIDWGSYFISIPLIVLTVWTGIKFFSKSYVNQQFNKLLETHKHELQMLMENNKFDLQRKMLDFNLFTTKKHEVYTNLYNLFLVAEGRARGIRGIGVDPFIRKYGRSEIEEYLKSLNMPSADIQSFVGNWTPENAPQIVDHIVDYLQKLEVRKAIECQQEAKNFSIYSGLYLSDNVAVISKELSKNLGSFCNDLNIIYNFNLLKSDRDSLAEEMRDKEKKIEELIASLKYEMQEELSIGYYKNPG
ncbi:hypothetical protein M3664_04450 [Paenibacillus lautus]|uniref:hypothetical protein n=1 Tax=Paenibacillus lautus TaxID=1401 RepID=UPI00203C9DC7|nr:hypothetical protein [Paenibacillus lautus]MCM3257031.1 hypothetical protein [Paenibacillus lautus]